MSNIMHWSADQPAQQFDKFQRNEIAKRIIESITEGNLNPLEVLQSVKAWKDIFETLTDSKVFCDALMDEMQKHGKSAVLNGNKLEISEAGTKYDFRPCNDHVWSKLQADKATLDAAIKSRETFLKTVPAAGVIQVDADTGEIYNIYPPVKTSKTIVKVTLK